jgi:hypothetical protein
MAILFKCSACEHAVGELYSVTCCGCNADVCLNCAAEVDGCHYCGSCEDKAREDQRRDRLRKALEAMSDDLMTLADNLDGTPEKVNAAIRAGWDNLCKAWGKMEREAGNKENWE